MGVKCLWTGLTFVVAISAALKAFGLNVDERLIVSVGAIFMLFGLYLLWNDR